MVGMHSNVVVHERMGIMGFVARQSPAALTTVRESEGKRRWPKIQGLSRGSWVIGCRGSIKVLLELAIPYHSTPYGWSGVGRSRAIFF
jgi:hypothetical protein